MKQLKHVRPLALPALITGMLSIAQPIWGYWGHKEPICDPIAKAWTYETKSWMSTIPDDTKLGDITMPSSHDAGMDEDREQSLPVTCAFSTQFESILEQMRSGSRFFDIRVKLLESFGFRCAHGTNPLWEYGYNMSEVLDQAVQFVTENPSETVILKFSHWQNDEVLSALDTIFKETKWTDHFYKAGSGTLPILNDVPLRELRGKIIFLLDYDYGIGDEPENALDHEVAKTKGYTPAKGTWRFGELAEGTKGKYGYYRVYDSYADDDEYAVMINDQRNKWRKFLKNFPNQTDNAFMVCWQLTGLVDIHSGALEINPKLDSDLTHLIQLFAERPRLVNLDFIDENVCVPIINANLPLVQKVDIPPVPYLDPVFVNGKLTGYETKYCEKYSILTGTYSNQWTIDLEDRWYVVDGSCSTTYSVYVSGDAHVILKNNSSLSVSPGADTKWAGIMTRSRDTYPTSALTIYGQSTDASVMGTLSAQGDTYGAGIGGEQNSTGHHITINGGKVTATGGENGAGIGGGKDSDGCDIIINGGYITANSGGKGAGIGGGYAGSGHRITINGGYITAKGYNGGAAIGGGEQHNGGGAGDGIVINGGTIDARTAWHTHNIGSGNDGPKAADDVKFNGGNILAKSSDTWGPYQPINGQGQRVYEVTVPNCGTSSDPIFITGLDGYGIYDLYQVDGEMKFWLPNGTYSFETLNTFYSVTVNGAAVTATETKTSLKGVKVDGKDVAWGSGEGWTFNNGVLKLTSPKAYTLQGSNTDGGVLIDVEAAATVTLDNLEIYAGNPGRNLINFTSGNASMIEPNMILKGVNKLSASNYAGVIHVAAGVKLTMTGDGEMVGGKEKNRLSKCVTVDDGGIFIMNSGTIRDYKSRLGGGIHTSGSVTINGGLITGNIAQDATDYGGGIYVEQTTGTLTVNDGTIVGNTATTKGGDIYNKATLFINGGTVRNIDWNDDCSPKNKNDDTVYKVTIPSVIADPPSVSGSASDYGVKDLHPYDEKLFFWLPNGNYSFQISDKIYTATVNNDSTTAIENAIPLRIKESGYATVYSEKKIYIPSGLQVFVYSFDEGSEALIPEEVPSGSILPAKTGFVVKAPAGDYFLYDYSSKEAGEFTSVLEGVTVDTQRSEIAGEDKRLYVLGTIDGRTTFYLFTGETLPAGKAYFLRDK